MYRHINGSIFSALVYTQTHKLAQDESSTSQTSSKLKAVGVQNPALSDQQQHHGLIHQQGREKELLYSKILVLSLIKLANFRKIPID